MKQRSKFLLASIASGLGAATTLSLSIYFAHHTYTKIHDAIIPFKDIEDKYERRSIVLSCINRSKVSQHLVKVFEPLANENHANQESQAVQIPSLSPKEKEDFFKCANNPLLNGQLTGERDKIRELFLPVILLSFTLILSRMTYRNYRNFKTTPKLENDSTPAP